VPSLSVRFVRASLLYLLVGFTLGALLLAQKGISFYPPIWLVFPVHIEFLLVGWLIQLAMGVGFWIFPRFGTGAARGNERLISAAFWLLNTGLLLAALQIWLSFALVAARLLESAAIIVYVSGSWSRIKPLGTSTRKS
jgi:hypothetical protein